MGINNVGKALERVGVNIRDAEGGFRDFSDVLNDLYPIWDSINEVEQANILKALAGTRQRESLLILLENESKYRKGLLVQQESEGKAMERYGEYLEGVEAAQNKMTASWEEFWQETIDSESISSFYNSLAGIIDLFGNLQNVLSIVIPVLILFNAELIKTKILSAGNILSGLLTGLQSLIPALMGTTVAAEGTAGAMMAANVAALPFVATVGAITAGLYLGIKAINDYATAQENLRNKIAETKGNLEDTASSYAEYAENTIKAAEAEGYYYKNGKMYHEGYHGSEIEVQGFDLLTEAQWNNKKALESLTETERDNISVRERAISVTDGASDSISAYSEKYTGLVETMKSMVDQPIDELIQKSMSEGIGFEDIEKIPTEYLDALTVEGDKLKLNIGLIKEYQLEQAKKNLETAKAADASQQEISVLQLYYDQLYAQSQQTFGQFGQTAWEYDQLLWQISNDAVAAGYSFVDMEGNALKSAEQIQQYLASSPAAFQNFTQQVANQTGRTVAEVTNIINQMIGNTINNLNAMQAASAGRYTAMAAQAGKTPTYNNVPSLFPTPAPSFGGASSGGGGASSATSKEQKEAEKLRKTEEAINDARKKGVDALKDQLKAYKDIIDIRKDLLDSMAEEREYNKDLEEKKDSISDIQNQIIELSMDDSEEAKARTIALQEELSKAQSDLEDFQYDRSIDVQKSALDKEYEALESKINSAIQQIENIDSSSLRNFTQQMAAILANMGLESHHKGLDSGAVGGTGGNEMFIKALKGEILVNEAQQENFMNKILPSMINSPQVSSLGGGNISLEMPINVAGNLDKTVMPDLERIASFVVKKINDSMLSRGYNRRTDMYALG